MTAFVKRARAGEVTGAEILDRLLTAILVTAAVAYAISTRLLTAARVNSPTLLAALKTSLAKVSDAIPEQRTTDQT